VLGPLPKSAVILPVAWVVIYVHELGHYVAGRRIVEIPDDDIRLVSRFFPRYVALRDGDDWVAPAAAARYWRVYERHDPDEEHRERFAAGGEIVQTAVLVPAAGLAAVAGFETLATTVLGVSLLTTAVFVVVDAVVSLRKDTWWGDYAILWAEDWTVLVLLLVGFSSVHLAVLSVLV
jgi:hypothetical protein